MLGVPCPQHGHGPANSFKIDGPSVAATGVQSRQGPGTQSGFGWVAGARVRQKALVKALLRHWHARSKVSLSLLAPLLGGVHTEIMTTDAGPRLDAALASRVNWLRAGVLGANDGIVSIAGLVFGVAGATSDSMAVLIAGAAGMVAGALSMGGGEYVSVSAQRDTEQSAGVSADHLTSPWQAASASMVAFVLGALIPLLGVVFAPVPVRLPVTIAAVLLALAVTGFTSARLSGVPVNRPVLRNLVVGTLAMGLTYAAGTLVGTQL